MSAANAGATRGRLQGQVALVTGAARGLGAGIARRLAAEGSVVVCADRAPCDDVVRHIITDFGADSARSISVDITDADAVTAIVDSIVTSDGRLDIAVNNAGVVQPFVQLAELDPSVIDQVLNVNLRGTLYCMAAEARAMKPQGHGRIINTASQLGVQGMAGLAVYSASKAGIIAATHAAALELAEFSITVNAIAPGSMRTEMSQEALGEMAAAAGITLDEQIEQWSTRIPVGRMGTPEDMGAMVAFLASEEAAFTTGSCLNLTGGEMLF